MKFYCVNDNVPTETIEYLKQSSSQRVIDFIEVNAGAFEPGTIFVDSKDLLFRPAISWRAVQVEQFLYRKGVSTFYSDTDGPLFTCSNPNLAFVKAGLPIPRYFTCNSFDPGLLRNQVDLLGGFPVVVKVSGYSRGVGVIRADSIESLVSIIEYLVAQGVSPNLSAYIPNAIHWRVVVVGKRAVAAYKNSTIENDFRTIGTTSPEEIYEKPNQLLEEIAVQSLEALRLEFGGVDLLEHESGRVYLLEANFPCYFAHAQIYGNCDVSGAMLDYLISKSKKHST